MRKADAGVARSALDHRATSLQRTVALGILSDVQRCAVLD
jgi:hypothetical protein